MATARAFVLAVLALLWCLSILDGAFAQQSPSQGYQLITNPQVSGGVLIAQRPTQRTATELLIQGFDEARSFFDARPWALASYQDQRRKEDAGAWFEGRIQRTIVSGLAFAGVTRGKGTIAFAFDSPQTIGQTFPRLLELVGPAGQDPTRGLNWRVTPFPDGSGDDHPCGVCLERPPQFVAARVPLVLGLVGHRGVESGCVGGGKGQFTAE